MPGCPKCGNNVVTVSSKEGGNFAASCESCGFLYTTLLSKDEIRKWLEEHCEIEMKGTVTAPAESKERGMVGGKMYGVVTNSKDSER